MMASPVKEINLEVDSNGNICRPRKRIQTTLRLTIGGNSGEIHHGKDFHCLKTVVFRWVAT
jgi:hypothetical protein